MARRDYQAQVALLLRLLPHVAEEPIFALKGGTAINLFYRDLPRLSVDIDLTYLPIKDRAESLVEINDAMDRIATAIERGSQTQRIEGGGGGATRVLARLNGAEIKIETSPVTRGAVHGPETRSVPEAVEYERRYTQSLRVSKIPGAIQSAGAGVLHPRPAWGFRKHQAGRQAHTERLEPGAGGTGCSEAARLKTTPGQYRQDSASWVIRAHPQAASLKLLQDEDGSFLFHDIK